jgi:hypothetical protein
LNRVFNHRTALRLTQNITRHKLIGAILDWAIGGFTAAEPFKSFTPFMKLGTAAFRDPVRESIADWKNVLEQFFIIPFVPSSAPFAEI